jgi:hypothetical protein
MLRVLQNLFYMLTETFDDTPRKMIHHTHSVTCKSAIIGQIGKKPLSVKNVLPVCDVYQCILALDNA